MDILGTMGATWNPPAPEPLFQTFIDLTINIPDHASVKFSENQVEITGITLADLVSLRDSISGQIEQMRSVREHGEEVAGGGG